MSSEVIVVLVMTVIAVGFIIWVRAKSQPEDHNERPGNKPQDTESAGR